MMNTPSRHVQVSAPGRVCLFGEHQDYLQLPVVPCAISLRITIEGWRSDGNDALLHLPDIGAEESFPLGRPSAYTKKRDYLRSAVNIVLRHGYTFRSGIEATVKGEIPINAGTSSSSALIVAWVALLLRLSDQDTILPPADIALLAHEAEVREFGEPGGMMDHFSSAIGGVLAIEFSPTVTLAGLKASLGTFVLGDSGEPKDTTEILARVKNQVLEISTDLQRRFPEFSLHTVAANDLARYTTHLEPEQRELLQGTLRNRDLTRIARTELDKSPLNHRRIGILLNEHQHILRDVLRISTPKIDRMLVAAMTAGAYGGKINGSGGGGCMFAYAPDDPDRVARAVEGAGGRAYVVSMDEGVHVEEFHTEKTHP